MERVLRVLLPTLALLTLLGIVAIADPIWGPEGTGQAPKHPPLYTAGLVQASPNSSPYTTGKVVPVAVDGYGRVMTTFGNVSLSAGNIGVLSNVGGGSVNVSLPAGSSANQTAVTADYDTGGASQAVQMLGLALPASGGAVAAPGTANGLYIIPRAANGDALAANDGGLTIKGYTAHDGGLDLALAPVQVGGRAYATGTLPSAVSADNDAAQKLLDRYGRARVSLETADSGASLAPNAYGLIVRGSDAHDATLDTGNSPVQAGARTANTLPTATSADGEATFLSATRQGQLRGIIDDAAGTVGVGHSVKCEASHAGGATEVTTSSSATLLKWIHVSSPNTSDVWLQLHNATNPNVGTDVPLMAILIPGGVGASNRAVYNQEFGPVGITFSTALTYTITTTAGGSTAPASACHIAMGYK